MELYLDVKPVGKGANGRTACGSSAYRSCSKVIDNDGRAHNYKNKHGHIAGGIELPKGAPAELLNPQVLWQRHDSKEIRKDAQIFREVIFSLPNELPNDVCVGIIKDLIAPLVKMGMCAQWDLHNPHDPSIRKTAKEEEVLNAHPENKHVHVMLTMRDLQADGTFGKKNRSWNQYNGGVNLAEELRPAAARLMNAQLEEYGFEKRVEYKSYAARGIDKLPQVHVGVAGTNIDRDGRYSYRKAMNDVIKQLNQENISYQEKIERLRAARRDLANVGVKDVQKPSLFDQINANEAIQRATMLEAAAGSRERIRANYANIKEFNQQIYDLRREKKQVEKWRRALYTYRNLSGDPNLTAEQKDQLQWAEGYIRWATKRDMLPNNAQTEALILRERERNTERCLGVRSAERGIREALNEIAYEKDLANVIREQEKPAHRYDRDR